MRRTDILALVERLSERDLAILRTLRAHRLATTSQLRRWHLPSGFASLSAASRATQRILSRLESHHLVARLSQRIGGVRRGSDSVIWQLARIGDRLLAVVDGDSRRRYVEPSTGFVSHTLAVTELAVQLVEAHLAGQLDTLAMIGEPDNWRRFLGDHGRLEILKPDLAAVTSSGEFEDHFYLERDQATEHPNAVIRKIGIYDRYAATGAYQARDGVFPAVVWIVPDQARITTLRRAIHQSPSADSGLHRFVTPADFVPTILAGGDAPTGPPISEQPPTITTQKGGTNHEPRASARRSTSTP